MCDAMSSSLSLPRGPAAGDAVPITVPRAQVSIERLPTRRQGNAPRESMNCKSCRKRKVGSGCHSLQKHGNSFVNCTGSQRATCKGANSQSVREQIKCNRVRPSCEACLIFQCPCVYGLFPPPWYIFPSISVSDWNANWQTSSVNDMNRRANWLAGLQMQCRRSEGPKRMCSRHY